MDLYIHVSVQPLFLCQLWVPVLLHYEVMDLPIQLVSHLLLSGILVIRHHTYLMQILVSATEPFVGLRVPDPSLVLISQTNPYNIGPFSISLWSVDRCLTWSSMGWCWNQVFAPWDGCDGVWFLLSLASHMLLLSRACKMSPLFRSSIPPQKCTVNLCTSLTCCLGTFALLWQCVM